MVLALEKNFSLFYAPSSTGALHRSRPLPRGASWMATIVSNIELTGCYRRFSFGRVVSDSRDRFLLRLFAQPKRIRSTSSLRDREKRCRLERTEGRPDRVLDVSSRVVVDYRRKQQNGICVVKQGRTQHRKGSCGGRRVVSAVSSEHCRGACSNTLELPGNFRT